MEELGDLRTLTRCCVITRRNQVQEVEIRTAARFRVTGPSSDAKPSQLAELALCFRSFLLSLSNHSPFENGSLNEFRFLLRACPEELGICLALGIACWIAYFSIRRRLRANTI
jgi:hypothetical protein